MEKIQEIFEELNFPSATRLKTVLTARKIPYNSKEVDSLVRGESTRQVQAPRYTYKGKIAATDVNSLFFADLIDFTAAPSADAGTDVGLRPTVDGDKYILCVQNVFTRFLYTEALPDKRPTTVAAAFQKILNRADVTPQICVTDGGKEFGQLFQEMLTKNKIAYHQKPKEDLHGISTLDVAIGYLKRALARDTRKQNTNDWASRLKKVTQGQNSLPNADYLEGVAPNDVKKDDDLKFDLFKKNAEFLASNQRNMIKRADKLQQAGSFRATEKIGGKFARAWKPRFESTVREIDEIKGARVIDTQGESYLTKLVQPVSKATTDSGPVRIEQGKSVQTESKQIQRLQPFADELKRYLDIMGTISAIRVLNILKGVRGPAALKAAAAETRLNKSSLVKNLVSLFPNMFKTEKRNNALFVSSIGSSSSKAPAIPTPNAPQRIVINERGHLILV